MKRNKTRRLYFICKKNYADYPSYFAADSKENFIDMMRDEYKYSDTYFALKPSLSISELCAELQKDYEIFSRISRKDFMNQFKKGF